VAQEAGSLHAGHRAGEKMFVDYCGRTFPIVDPATGEIEDAQVFVAVMDASNYTFAESTWSQALPDWTGFRRTRFHLYGGGSKLLGITSYSVAKDSSQAHPLCGEHTPLR
jgi:transposase